MLNWSWLILVGVGLLWYRNTRYAIKQYLANRSYMIFTVYMLLLLGLGYLVIHVTTRVVSLVQASQELLDTQ